MEQAKNALFWLFIMKSNWENIKKYQLLYRIYRISNCHLIFGINQRKF